MVLQLTLYIKTNWSPLKQKKDSEIGSVVYIIMLGASADPVLQAVEKRA